MADRDDVVPSAKERSVSRAPLAAALGTALAGEPAFRQPVDEQRRFVNLDGSRPPDFGAMLKWAVLDRVTGKRRRSPDCAPIPRVDPDLARIARPPGTGEGPRIIWLGHASFLVQLDGVSLLFDPALMERILGVPHRNVPPGVRIEQLPPIDSVLVTHSHYDHLDLPTLVRVNAPVVAGLGVCHLLRDEGLGCRELGWWQSAKVGNVTVTFVPSQHWSRRTLGDTNRTLWGGFVVQGSSATVYHAGDTAYFGGFAEIGRRFPAIDAAMLPIGAYDPPWFMERMHMNPEQALRAFTDLGARAFVAMHWGTFKLTDEPLDEPPRRLEAERIRRGLPRQRVLVPAVGETVALEISRARR